MLKCTRQRDIEHSDSLGLVLEYIRPYWVHPPVSQLVDGLAELVLQLGQTLQDKCKRTTPTEKR